MWAIQQLIVEKSLEDIHAVFRDGAIQYMPIKGAFLVGQGLASKITKRRMNDIDILVPKKDYKKAIDFLQRDKRFVKQRADSSHFHSTLSYAIADTHIRLEVHHSFNDPLKYVLPSEDLFARCRRVDSALCMPTLEDALLMAMCHALSHIGVYLTEQLFIDMDAIIAEKTFCWQLFWEYAKKTRAASWACFMAALYEKERGVSVTRPHCGLYVQLLSRRVSVQAVNRMPGVLRRLILEAPFVKRPCAVYCQRLLKRIRAALPNARRAPLG